MVGKSVRLLTWIILGVICGSAIMGAASSIDVYPRLLGSGASGFTRFTSEESLRAFLKDKQQNGYYYTGRGIRGGVFAVPGATLAVTSIADAATAAAASAKVSAEGYSTTNVQVEGVDEGDVVKTDGTYIYLTRSSTVFIIKAIPPSSMKIVSRIELTEQAGDLYVLGDKLVVFGSGGIYVGSYPAPWEFPKNPIIPPTRLTVSIRVYDVKDRSKPTLERDFGADGYLVSSRMIGDYLYAIVQKGAYIGNTGIDLPVCADNRTVMAVKATDILYYNGTDSSYSYTTIASINVASPDEPVNVQTFLIGSSSVIYCSTSSLYVTTGGYTDTTIHKITFDNGKVKDAYEGTVPGWVLNQFSMDESGDYFRIATTSGGSGWLRSSSVQSSAVYVFDQDMKLVGKLEGLAPGESIYSARFMGDRCYLVTFKKVDPLFVIDLSKPTAPKVLGKLKIPGYSNYLHPYDATHLIGVGKETEEAEGGNFAWYQGLKISLFDVSDVANPIEVAKIEVGDRGTDSPALSDHKAFLFDKERGLLVIPVLEARINASSYGGAPPANAYGDYIYQGAYVFNINTSSITLRGRITHVTGDELSKSGYWFNSDFEVVRSLYIGNTLYTLSGRMVKANTLSDLNELSSILLK